MKFRRNKKIYYGNTPVSEGEMDIDNQLFDLFVGWFCITVSPNLNDDEIKELTLSIMFDQFINSIKSRLPEVVLLGKR